MPLDDGGTYHIGPTQQFMWHHWRKFWDEWVPHVTKGEPFAVVHNGDVVEGVVKQSTTPISGNLGDQAEIAYQVLAPVVDACQGRFYQIRGTEAHTGKSAVEEEKLAKRLGAIPNQNGQYSRYEMSKRVGDGLVHLAHHIGVTSSSQHESAAVNAELVKMYVEASRWGNEPVDMCIRSHRHRYIEVMIAVNRPDLGQFAHNQRARAVVTPAWQGKMLELNTLLPTPDGWTTMGDVKAGDILFDERGEQCSVVESHPILLRPESFLVKFSNGEQVKACADHLWLTTAQVDRPGVPGSRHDKRPLTRVRTTREIHDTMFFGDDRRNNHRLFMPDALQIDDADLPIDPYILGCWLGDGDSDAARITCTPEDAAHYAEEFQSSGYSLSVQNTREGKTPRYAVRACDNSGWVVTKASTANLQKMLRSNHLLCNKHIPPAYLRGSFQQRLSLVQGLMDTDGSSSGRNMCVFTNTNKAIADGLAELLASFGIKYRLSQRAMKLKGKIVGSCWKIQFFASPDFIPVFRLQRKIDNLALESSRATAPKSRSVQIVAVEPCEPVPMRCITVDSPSGLYRFGKTMLYTHNTPFGYRIARGKPPQFGGVCIRWDGKELFTNSYVVTLSETEID